MHLDGQAGQGQGRLQLLVTMREHHATAGLERRIWILILIKQAAPASISKRLAFSVPFRKWKIFTRLINHLFYFRKSNEMPTAKEPIEPLRILRQVHLASQSFLTLYGPGIFYSTHAARAHASAAARMHSSCFHDNDATSILECVLECTQL